MRLIDADALKEEICKRYRHFSQRLAISPVLEAIKEAHSIDAVPREKYDRMKENAKILSKACAEKEYVIRCKDCKWCDENCDTHGYLPHWFCKNWYGGTDADGYCHEAARKEE